MKEFKLYSASTQGKVAEAFEAIKGYTTSLEKTIDELLQNQFTEGLSIETLEPVSLGDFKSSIEGYHGCYFDSNKKLCYQTYSNFHHKSYQKTIEVADQHLDYLWQTAVEIHKRNTPKIENNKKIRGVITQFMSLLKISPTYTEYTYPTARSKTKQAVSKTAGWMDDMIRLIKIDDGFTIIQNTYQSYLKRIEEYRKAQQKIEEEAQRQLNIAQDKELKDRSLAALVIKYNRSYNSSWLDLLSYFLDRDATLRMIYQEECGDEDSQYNKSDYDTLYERIENKEWLEDFKIIKKYTNA